VSAYPRANVARVGGPPCRRRESREQNRTELQNFLIKIRKTLDFMRINAYYKIEDGYDETKRFDQII
jgi:hypothetical protein